VGPRSAQIRPNSDQEWPKSGPTQARISPSNPPPRCRAMAAAAIPAPSPPLPEAPPTKPYRRPAVDHKQQTPLTTAPPVACAAHSPRRPEKQTRGQRQPRRAPPPRRPSRRRHMPSPSAVAMAPDAEPCPGPEARRRVRPTAQEDEESPPPPAPPGLCPATPHGGGGRGGRRREGGGRWDLGLGSRSPRGGDTGGEKLSLILSTPGVFFLSRRAYMVPTNQD
jgi:hypothetical protein